MSKTTFSIDEDSCLKKISLVFSIDGRPGLQSFNGSPGEDVRDILARWLAQSDPGQTYKVSQAGFETTWIATPSIDKPLTITVVI